MKASTIIAVVILGVGIYIAYEKDSSFTSIDLGSIAIGSGLGFLIGSML